MEPLTQNSLGFLNLLATQSSQTIDLQSFELPRFSSQSSEDPKLVERRKWTQKEDIVLIIAWLNTSKDPIVGNEQRAGAFWKRIEEYFNSSYQVSGSAPRESSQCKQRWGRLNEQVCKFVGSYEAALKEQASGQNETDVMKAAHDIFLNDYQVKFSLEHAWRELRFDQKWRSNCLNKDGSKDERDGYTQYNTSDFVAGDSSRSSQVDFSYSTDIPSNIDIMLGIRNEIQDNRKHDRLKS